MCPCSNVRLLILYTNKNKPAQEYLRARNRDTRSSIFGMVNVVWVILIYPMARPKFNTPALKCSAPGLISFINEAYWGLHKVGLFTLILKWFPASFRKEPSRSKCGTIEDWGKRAESGISDIEPLQVSHTLWPCRVSGLKQCSGHCFSFRTSLRCVFGLQMKVYISLSIVMRFVKIIFIRACWRHSIRPAFQL